MVFGVYNDCIGYTFLTNVSLFRRIKESIFESKDIPDILDGFAIFVNSNNLWDKYKFSFSFEVIRVNDFQPLNCSAANCSGTMEWRCLPSRFNDDVGFVFTSKQACITAFVNYSRINTENEFFEVRKLKFNLSIMLIF